MKKLIIILALTGLLALPSVSLAQTCSSPINIDILAPAAKFNAIRNALINYTSYPEGDNYEICFTMSELVVSSSTFTDLTLLTNIGETKDVYVVGLKLRNDAALPVTAPLLVVENRGAEASKPSIILKDISLVDVKNGIGLIGRDNIKLMDSVIAGDDSKSGVCVDIEASNALVEGAGDDIEITSCGKGINIHGVNPDGEPASANIKNSRIWDNKIGVEIGTGVVGSDIEGSLIYSNNDEVITGPDDRQRYDGVKIADGAAHKPLFYAVINNEPDVIPDTSDDPINYGERPAYVLLNFSIGQVDPSRVEILTSHPELCGLPPLTDTRHQPCGAVMADGSPIKLNISPSDLEDGPMEVVVPPEYRDKDLVVMYSDPGEGTAGISREFKWTATAGGVVAFVSNPYDIPTTGGASETELTSGGEGEIEEGGGNELEGGGISGEGGGGSILSASSGGCGGGGASLANNSFRHVVFSFNVWWILLALILAGGIRLAAVKVRERRKSR